ncbi:hypothetical protein AB837_00407 [bacterium AB1]|nr:hypothetical protein AB837_00407 [bacterium AB1]
MPGSFLDILNEVQRYYDNNFNEHRQVKTCLHNKTIEKLVKKNIHSSMTFHDCISCYAKSTICIENIISVLDEIKTTYDQISSMLKTHTWCSFFTKPGMSTTEIFFLQSSGNSSKCHTSNTHQEEKTIKQCPSYIFYLLLLYKVKVFKILKIAVVQYLELMQLALYRN